MSRHHSHRVAQFGTTIFSEITEQAVKHNAINLGQGFPDTDGPESVIRAAVEALETGKNQYARGSGVLELCESVSKHQERFYGLRYDATSEVTVTSGATEAVFATIQALCDPGEEVVVFDPMYDSYAASIRMADAVPKPVVLDAGTQSYDPSALEASITERTRAVLLNTPHNPTGKVFTRDELEHIGELSRKHDLWVISDEVYEHLVYDGEHIPIAALPGMRERTVSISSAGKTFSLTGWKVGWACAPAPLSAAVRTAHQFITFATATPLQHAVAKALSLPDSHFAEFRTEYVERRNLLCQGLDALGFHTVTPAGTYFVFADIRPLGFQDGQAFCKILPEQAGVAAVPASALYSNHHLGTPYVRFAFCKQKAVLNEALDRLSRTVDTLQL